MNGLSFRIYSKVKPLFTGAGLKVILLLSLAIQPQ
jgi:hypothetical protein